MILGKQFEELKNPQSFFSLSSAGVRGWAEIFPKFKSGDYFANSDGTTTYLHFGAGVMFIPSGLAYYSESKPNIPAYSSLIFSVKLYEVQRVDHY